MSSIIPPEQQQQQQQPYFNITRPFNGCEPAKLLPESISWDQNTCQMHSGKPPTRRHSNVASGFQLTANDIPNSTGLLQQGVHFSSLATSSKTEARTSYAVAPTLSTTNPNHSEYQFLDDHKEFSSNRSQEQSASKRKQLLTPLSKKLRKLIQQFADTTIDKVHSARKRSTLFSTATRNGDSFTESNLFWAMATGCRSEGAQRHAKGRVNLQIYDEFLTPSTSVQTSPKAREKKVDARRARRVELRLGRQYEAWSSTYKG
ncbi:hypothetical protein KEM54_000848 [Ascosphaera aggregata]|nr:hypothetical protein KEM54_000848 [Ascosphaera aggregata]